MKVEVFKYWIDGTPTGRAALVLWCILILWIVFSPNPKMMSE